ncbi:MAG: STAS domain-containing protein [Phycisphaerales bacterium]
MSTLRTSIDSRHDQLTLRLTGDAGVRNLDTLDRVARLLAVTSPRRVVVNLSGVTFISSLGVGVLARLQRVVEASGGTLVVSDAPKPIGDVIRHCRVGDLLPEAEHCAKAS